MDGFRGLLWHRTSAVMQLLSRNGPRPRAVLPELAQAGQTLPPRTLIDGETVSGISLPDHLSVDTVATAALRANPA
ncbi:MAG: hypothetical protein M3069_17640 [Chloroflexota bacterium]|nr:hypothetical protein [Chloroflexota bacterium]